MFLWNIIRRKLHDLLCLYSSSQAILKLSQSARGHFMTLIESGVHYITCNPGHKYVVTTEYFLEDFIRTAPHFERRIIILSSKFSSLPPSICRFPINLTNSFIVEQMKPTRNNNNKSFIPHNYAKLSHFCSLDQILRQQKNFKSRFYLASIQLFKYPLMILI